MVDKIQANKEKTDESVNYLHLITNTFPWLELLLFLDTQEIATFWKKVVYYSFQVPFVRKPISQGFKNSCIKVFYIAAIVFQNLT